MNVANLPMGGVMRKFAVFSLFCLLVLQSLYPQAPAPAALDSRQATERLLAGNRRFANGQTTHPDQAGARRIEVAKGQHPFAAVLGCTDSRIPPEIIFDQGLGDLFVARVAGNTLNDALAGSLEYAVARFSVPLVLVLGHTRCGAVVDALKGAQEPGHIPALLHALDPAIERAKNRPGDVVDNTVRANVEVVVNQLTADPVLAPAVKSGKLQITGAIYNMETGVVEILR
jgi:carbonic anhydrase